MSEWAGDRRQKAEDRIGYRASPQAAPAPLPTAHCLLPARLQAGMGFAILSVLDRANGIAARRALPGKDVRRMGHG